jgi:5-methylcytosine-specific restriction enzyme subunit McrC
MKTLKVFEHHTITAGQILDFYHGKDIRPGELHVKYIDALWKLYDAKKMPFFRPIRKGVCFQEYVGVVKVLDLTIEILPKADNQPVNKANATELENKWQSILIDMLRVCHLIDTPSISDAHLKIRSNSILDLYIERFINEVNSLIRQGLIKRYRKVEGNSNALKGKLLIGKHIQKNLVHQERFYISQTQYDKNHLLHKILNQAIKILPGLCNNQVLISECYSLQLNFPEVDDIKITENIFDKINFDRKSEPYDIAIKIAKMLLLNYRPDLSTGRENSIAILFNMNLLWEEYIYRTLLKDKPAGIQVHNQKSIRFWESGSRGRKIKPDIVIESPAGKIVIDTKWKNIYNDIGNISLEDLRQMYAYHHYFEASECYLLYPGNDEPIQKGIFSNKYFFGKEELESKHCGFIIKKPWIDKIDDKKTFLNKELGKNIYKSLGLITGV